MSAAVKSTARADSRNGSKGFARIASAVSDGVKVFHRRRAGFELIGSERARLDGREMRGCAAGFHIRVQLALKKLADENGRAGFHAKADGVADEHLPEASGEFGREVANLIGMRKKHQCGIDLANQLLKRRGVSVGRVSCEEIMLDGVDALQFLGGKFIGEPADRDGGGRTTQLRGQLLSGREGFPRHAIPSAAALLRDHQNTAHMTRTSNLSFSTSFAAASLALPSRIWVCLVRCGA